MSARVVTEKSWWDRLSEWKAEAFLEVLEQAGNRDESWRMAVVSGGEDTRREIEKLFRCRLQRLPASADAFRITREEIPCLRTYCLRGGAGQGEIRTGEQVKNDGRHRVLYKWKKRAVVHSVGTAAENVSRKTFWK